MSEHCFISYSIIDALGFPRAGTLFALLTSVCYMTLDKLLVVLTPINVVEALVSEACNRLGTNAQKVMQALANKTHINVRQMDTKNI